MDFIDTYRELLVHKPETVRARLRNLALTAIAGGFNLLYDGEKYLRRPRVQFLYIHHVFRDEENKLDALMKYLSHDHYFISYTEAVDRILNGKVDKPYICISSDDGLKNNLRAAEILNAYAAKACFFICPSVIDETSEEKIRDFARYRLHFPPVEFMTWKDVESLQKQGHEIGAHTLSHINIASSPREELQEEIVKCHKVIEDKCGSADHFAYPYGRYADFTEYARQIVFQNCFKSCASAERGCHITVKDEKIAPCDLFIRRDHVILTWPLEHILFFITRNSGRADIKNNFSPTLCA